MQYIKYQQRPFVAETTEDVAVGTRGMIGGKDTFLFPFFFGFF
jgi:hypothetical protein